MHTMHLVYADTYCEDVGASAVRVLALLVGGGAGRDGGRLVGAELQTLRLLEDAGGGRGALGRGGELAGGGRVGGVEGGRVEEVGVGLEEVDAAWHRWLVKDISNEMKLFYRK